MKNIEMNNFEENSPSNWKMLFALIFAGEMIFSLPFHIARFFRPTLLETFSLTNTVLGDTFAIYGIVAMICYFPGGVIADYFTARRLLTFSLFSTALGGIVFYQIPQGITLQFLFGYWGFTTILLFWAGMIKATREWGGESDQGKAFGILDGGRGLVAALVSTFAVIIFSHLVNSSFDSDAENNIKGMQAVIFFYSLMTLLAALLVWFFIPENNQLKSLNHPWQGMKQAMISSKTWLQALIVVCAYCAYKGADNYGIYAVQILSMDHVDAATFTSSTAYLRPIGAVAAGFLADRFSAARITAWCFAILSIVYFLLSTTQENSILVSLAIFNLVVSFLAVFALRGVYFVLVKESKVDLKVTGTAVGFISLIGYTPDIFFASITGRILDANPGVEGFSNYFVLMMAIAFVGLLAAIFLSFKNRVINPE